MDAIQEIEQLYENRGSITGLLPDSWNLTV
jgi:hypothetical protein